MRRGWDALPSLVISVLTPSLKDFQCFFADLKPPEARAGTLGEGCDGVGDTPSLPPLLSMLRVRGLSLFGFFERADRYLDLHRPIPAALDLVARAVPLGGGGGVRSPLPLRR